jgi:hypothetical protein
MNVRTDTIKDATTTQKMQNRVVFIALFCRFFQKILEGCTAFKKINLENQKIRGLGEFPEFSL